MEEQAQAAAPVPAKPKGPTWGERSKEWKQKLKTFWQECRRVLTVTKKPDKTEFTTVVKITGIGILIIGFIGFIIHLIKELLF